MILNYLDFHMEDIDMATSMVIGTQWGDEGKGKIVDWIAERADVVVRSQGGNNAGHTVVVDDKAFALRLYQVVSYTITNKISWVLVLLSTLKFCYKKLKVLKSKGRSAKIPSSFRPCMSLCHTISL